MMKALVMSALVLGMQNIPANTKSQDYKHRAEKDAYVRRLLEANGCKIVKTAPSSHEVYKNGDIDDLPPLLTYQCDKILVWGE